MTTSSTLGDPSAFAADSAPSASLSDMHPVLPVRVALVITLVAVVLIAAFIAIGAGLGIVPLYAGFLLLWFWTSVDQSDIAKLPSAMLGALTGTGLSFLLQWGTRMGSPVLIIGALALMVVALFLVIGHRLHLVCNANTMLFVTVLNAAPIQKSEDFAQILEATVLGVIWFGLCIWLGTRLTAGRAAT